MVLEKAISKSDDLADKLGDAHCNILSTKRILVCLSALALASVISFADQTGITVGLPQIAEDLNAQNTINWAGTASLLANTVCQVLFGRMSDIFGRKNVLMACLLILAIGDIACAVARTGVQFFIFRALAGIGNGGVSSLSMVILSDIVTLKQRGKFQGILGSSVGIGNAIGPFLMAGFIRAGTWRGFYYFLAPMCVVVMVAIYFLIDGRGKELNGVISRKEKFKKIDYLGSLTITAGLTLVLVPISGGGSSYLWSSALVIVTFIIGGLLCIAFIIVEWKIPELPMIPLRLFKNPSLCLLFASNFFFGASYFSFTYYLPYYFQVVKGKDTIHTSIFVLPLVLTQAIMSVVAGQIISYSGRYLYVVMAGFATWTLGNGLLLLWDRNLNDGIIILILLIMGSGVGFSFQPSMVAVQAQARKADRAVVISTRNVMRSLGGCIGIALGSTIVSNSMLSQLNTTKAHDMLPLSYIESLKANIYSKVSTDGLNIAQQTYVKDLYVKALHNYFYMIIPFMGFCLLSCFFVKDRGLCCLDELPEAVNKEDLESSASSHYPISTSTSRTSRANV
ncbi:MFS efflux transporter [Suhomyces tanzawaensis NRRL Y-17324]|uniref:MFS efflux transporter n=1 Tax=Suhomyces tanzawaensis NRRL Y-17324 TaxID=984487 RepID=A0A1E4SNJ3_9ASCO|nr:MFS efflux transporter [Suhomyces tanzawaensis NRRL Y-17324]ODV81083.1 MFS efflux transporter [Suhomyces tanzawaensis NRRL Y-17324]